jgi:hypothetical protein
MGLLTEMNWYKSGFGISASFSDPILFNHEVNSVFSDFDAGASVSWTLQ